MPLEPRRLLAVAATALLAGVVPALADFELERELALEPGGRFLLDSDNGRVTVGGSDRSGARVRITCDCDDAEERYRFSFSERPGVAEVEVSRRGSRLGRWSWRDSLRFEIELPRSTDLRIETAGGRLEVESIAGDAELTTSGGPIRLADLDGRIAATTSGGSIHASRLAGEVILRTSGGSIVADGVDGDLSARTSGGSIELREIGGRVAAETSGGSVTASLAAGNGAGGRLSTSGGGVTAYLDPAAALDIDASASGGRVVVDPQLEIAGEKGRASLRGALNGGGPRLVLRTSGGGIRLRAR